MKALAIGLGVAAALALAACGGTDKGTASPQGGAGHANEKTQPPPPKPTAEQQRAAAIRELDTRQHKACEPVCARISDCAIEDARKNDPAMLKKPPGPQKLWELSYNDCLPRCRKPKLSLRQVKIYETCGKIERNCAKFVTCMDAAAPKPPKKP